MSQKEDDHLSLIKRFKEGDESALEELIVLHSEGLFRFIYWHLQDAHEARDVLSQTFYKAYDKRSRYRPQPGAQFQTWLYTITANLCRDHLRKRKRRPGDYAAGIGDSNSLERDAGPAPEASPSEQAAQAEEILLMRQAIATLPPPLRDALILFALEGESQKDVARKLNCTVRAVEARVRRAKHWLKIRLERDG